MPPESVVERLHREKGVCGGGTSETDMRQRRLMAGVDVVCAQGGEGGGAYGGYQCEFYSFLRVWMSRGGFIRLCWGGGWGWWSQWVGSMTVGGWLLL